LALVGLPTSAFAEISTTFNVEVSNDTRVDVDRIYSILPDDDDPDSASQIVETNDPDFARNETAIRFKLRVAPHPQVRFQGDIELIWLNASQRVLDLPELTQRWSMDPWRLECDAAYIDIRDVVPGLDIRIGRQIVHWGSADMFNPTSVLNADDLEDRAVFREPIANEMIRIDYTYIPEREGWLGDVIFTLVWGPIFRPSQLPRSAILPLADNSEEIPVVEDEISERIGRLRGLVRNWLYDPNVHTEQPEFSLANSQFGARVQARMGETDFALSYYRGFDDIPVMTRADAEIDDDGIHIHSDVTLTYPRMNMFGFDLNGQLSFLGNAGFWVEGAVMYPERMGLTFVFPALPPIMPEPEEIEGTAVEGRPFLKLTVGLDYSFNEHAMIFTQYVRGMINEFGASSLSNILFVGLDLKFWNDLILLRLVGLMQMDFLGGLARGEPRADVLDQISGNLFPMLRISPWGAIEIDLGAIIPIGRAGSYFGQRATGATTVFLRARAAF
jgi:hypothetical protein